MSLYKIYYKDSPKSKVNLSNILKYNQNKNHMSELNTRDFYLACLIIAEGYELKDHIREKGFTLFIFENSQDLQNIVNRFYSQKYLIEPIKYSQAIRSLKGIIYSSVSTSTQVISNVKQYKDQQS